MEKKKIQQRHVPDENIKETEEEAAVLDKLDEKVETYTKKIECEIPLIGLELLDDKILRRIVENDGGELKVSGTFYS